MRLIWVELAWVIFALEREPLWVVIATDSFILLGLVFSWSVFCIAWQCLVRFSSVCSLDSFLSG